MAYKYFTTRSLFVCVLLYLGLKHPNIINRSTYNYSTANSSYNQVGYNELSGYNEVDFGPFVALLMQITSVITK